ncbi:enoyl-ACP reductase [Rhodoferax sp. 4810]|uniref:Enoyl-[acyl-carrier-protein] reductase [NADH] n=1 Tax=Thiospirillum jenense TaxID=1653858 RepID=A0A839H703_9GAMM|nr:enoyl-ACP reductase [Thiospirillum jenense]MBB1074691.1 enoyl-ACP reductase [Rhodoferax jenense]MBB1125465.1 enoyl-ACP reductase [Thiospirillum jenense]
MGFLTDKRFLVTGVASNRSIAWGIAQALHQQGAELTLTYQGDKLRGRVEELAGQCGAAGVLPLDVGSDAQITACFDALGQQWDGLDGIIHAVAFAPREELEGDYLNAVTRQGFALAHDISSYSFAALAKAGRDLMRGRKAALLTVTYLGALRAVPNYNAMGVAKASLEANVRYMAAALGPEGIRVNAVSAGPIRTLAASGISDFRSMLKQAEDRAPLRRNVSIDDVGNAAAFLCSDLAAGITGDVLYVDAGFHITI